jgi:hypothetical protein
MRRSSLHAGLLALALALPLTAAAAEEAPGTFKLPGTESTIKFYGYTQLDATLDFSGRPVGYENSDWATILPAVPADESPAGKRLNPQLYLTARTSRFGLQTSTPTSLGNVGVRLEADFNGPNDFQSETFTNSVLFRLRHAYGTVGGLLVGQTWTTFIDLAAAPETVDFNGPGTLALVRNPMIRYTLGLGDGLNLALAAENRRGPQFGVDDRFQTLPDFHANLTYAGNWGHVSVRGVTQQYNSAALNPAGTAYVDADSESAFGVAGAVSGSFKIGGDTLVAQFVGGPGVGRYVLNAIAAPFYTRTANDVELWTVWGAHAGYTHVWSPQFRSTIVGAYTWVDDAKIGGVAATDQIETMVQGFANTFWTFAKNAEFGVEYAYGRWENFASGPEDKGTQNRINAAFHYNFF